MNSRARIHLLNVFAVVNAAIGLIAYVAGSGWWVLGVVFAFVVLVAEYAGAYEQRGVERAQAMRRHPAGRSRPIVR